MTNEKLRGICSSKFELAHYAINIGKHHIRAGQDISLKAILQEVSKHPNPSEYLRKLDEIEKIEEKEE